MIMRGTTPRSLTWPAWLAVLGLGVGLLPLVPTWVQGEPPNLDQPPAQEKKLQAEEVIFQGITIKLLNAEDADGAQKELAQLAAEIERLHRQLKEAEARFQQMQQKLGKGAPPPDGWRVLTKVVPAEAARSEVAGKARTEVEILKAQLEARKALLRVDELESEAAKQNLERLKELHQKGAVPEKALAEAKAELEKRLAQLEAERAELKEPEVRLKQAAERLAGVEKGGNREIRIQPVPTPSPPVIAKWGVTMVGPAEQERRLTELEKKLDVLLKEVAQLRGDLRKQPPQEKPPAPR